MKLSDIIEFSSRPAGERRGQSLTGTLLLNVERVLTPESNPAAIDALVEREKRGIRRAIVETIQPRADFEAEFAELRVVIQSQPSLSMDDTMRILDAVATLKEKLLLK